MLKGVGGTTSFVVVLTRELEVFQYRRGGGGKQKSTLSKGGGGGGFNPVLRGHTNSFRPDLFPLRSPLLPVFNDWSLSTCSLSGRRWGRCEWSGQVIDGSDKR